MSNRPDDARRPTKAERKEQARLERESIQREMAARKRNRTIGLSLVALAVVVAIVAIVVLPDRESSRRDARPADDPPTLPEQAAARSRQTTDFYEGRRPRRTPTTRTRRTSRATSGSRELPPLDTYPSTPPASGPHTGAATLPAGVYDSPPDIGPLIHSLEHGGTVVWYDPDASAGRAADRSSTSTTRATRSARTA